MNTNYKTSKKNTKENNLFDDIVIPDTTYSTSSEGHLILPAENEKIREMIDFLKSDMNKHHVSSEKQFNLIIAAEEIFTNIASYAYENSGIVIIRTWVQDKIYHVCFIDNGRKYNPLKNKDPDINVDIKDREIGGLGVFLAKKRSDKISYSYKKKQNILTIGVYL